LISIQLVGFLAFQLRSLALGQACVTRNMSSTTLDLKSLEAELARTKQKLEAWTTCKLQTANELKIGHVKSMSDNIGKARTLHEQHQKLGHVAQAVKQRVEREEGEVSSLARSVSHLRSEQDSMSRTVLALQEAVNLHQQECQQKEDDTHAFDMTRKKKLGALKRVLTMYSTCLGLEFKQGPDELHLVFTHVHAKQPERQFVLGVKILPDSTYQGRFCNTHTLTDNPHVHFHTQQLTNPATNCRAVTKCEPQLESMPRLLARLNTSSDFSEFVKAARSEFKKVA